MKIFFVSLEDCDVGEVEGMFDDKGNIIGAWCNNDACWRGEYFEDFMRHLGIEVIDSFDEGLEQKLKEHFSE